MKSVKDLIQSGAIELEADKDRGAVVVKRKSFSPTTGEPLEDPRVIEFTVDSAKAEREGIERELKRVDEETAERKAELNHRLELLDEVADVMPDAPEPPKDPAADKGASPTGDKKPKA